ncbi:MAG: hypothetical protein WDW36_006659 [Sanguina aurantia]
MLGRRVSFAPDDELETMHLFNKDGKAMGNMSPGTPQEQTLQMVAPTDQPNDLERASISAQQEAARQVNESLLQWGGGESLMMVPSLDVNDHDLSPLSMDLTSTSIDSRLMQQQQQGDQPQQQHTSELYLSGLNEHEEFALNGEQSTAQGGHASASGAQLGGQTYPTYGGADFTRNITCNVPALSTLVEEDEEAGDLVSEQRHQQQQQPGSPMQLTGELDSVPMQRLSSGEMSPELGVNMFSAFERVEGGHGIVHDSSPISPYVSQQLGLRPHATPDTPVTGNLRDKWGFNPGADDTLDVSHGHLVMGDKTYNHVYGSSLTGEITRAIGAGQLNPMAGSLVTARAQLVNAIMKQQPLFPDMAALPNSEQHTDRRDSQPAHELQNNLHSFPTAQNEPPTDPWGSQAAAASQPLQLLSPVESPGNPSPAPLQPTTHAAYAPSQTLNTWAPSPNQHQQQQQQGPYHQSASQPQLGSSQPPVATTAAAVPQSQPMAAHEPSSSSSRGTDGARAGTSLRLPGGTTQLLQHPNYTTHLLDDVSGRVGAGRAAASAAPVLRPADRTVKSSDVADGMLDEYTLDDFALPPTPSAPKSSSSTLPPLQQQQQQQHSQHLMHAPSMPSTRLPASSMLSGNYSSSNNAGLALLQKAAALPLPEEVAGEGAAGRVHATRSRPSNGPVPSSSQEERRQAEAHPITCQDFLSILGISFAEKVRRTSFLPKADPPPPEGFAATYEAAFVTGARCTEYQSTMQQMSARLAQVQSGLQATEADMAMSNPRMFQTVQASSSNELDRLKDQMILLRRICRLRATKAHKLTRIEFEEQLSNGLNRNMQQLQQELAFMRAELGSAQQLEQLFKSWQVDEADRTQQHSKKLEEAALHQRVVAAKQQRLSEAESSNTARASRVGGAQRGLQDLQAQCADVQQRKLQLQQKLAACQSSSSAAAAAPKQPNALAADMASRQRDLGILLGLQGLKVDVTGFAATQGWSMTVDGTAEVQVGMASLQASGNCSVGVTLLRKGACWEDVTHGLFRHAASSCLGSSNRLDDVPLPRLTPLLRSLHTQLGLASALAAQIPPLLQAFPLLGNASCPASLLLTFLNPATSTKIVVSLPASGLHHMCTVSPALGVRVVLPEVATALESGASICTVLQDIQPSEVYLQHVCTVMSTILLSSTGGQAEGGGAWAADSEVQMAARTPMRAGRVYDNPLFG